MNLNDFVVLPNNKAKSVKLNARNLQELKMETANLALESKEMEEKLQQLKESMSKEKEERGHSGGFRWKSGQRGSLNSNALTNSTKKNQENRLQKQLSVSKVKIRVLKDEPLTVPPQPLPPPPASATGFQMTRINRLSRTICGQCEVKSAGLMCAECTENYCIGCFARFHQKGALKLHRMIPIQTDLRTHVSTPDVIGCFQKQRDHNLYPSTFTNPNFKPNPTFTSNASTKKHDQNPEKEKEDVAKTLTFHPDSSQILAINCGKEKKVEMIEDGLERKDEEGFTTSLLKGEYSEEESAKSFQEALRQWKEEKSDVTGQLTSEGAMWMPVQTVSVLAVATQVDLPPDRGAEGRVSGGQVGRIPVTVEFTENILTYLDRLLLKKHRRTPIEPWRTMLGFAEGFNSLPTEGETTNSQTAQEEDFHHYCASLFGVPVSGDRPEPQITTPESCLVIEVLDETDRDISGVFVDVQSIGDNKRVPSVQWFASNGTTQGPQTTTTTGESTSLSLSYSCPAQPSRQSGVTAQTKAVQKFYPSKPQTSQADFSLKLMPSICKPSASPTAETPRTSKTSIKTPTLKSHTPNCSLTVHKSKADCGSPQHLSSHSLLHSQNGNPKFSQPPPPFSADFSLVQKVSESPLFPQSSHLHTEPILSTNYSQSPPTNMKFSTQSVHSLCVPESLPSAIQLQCPLSLVSSWPNAQPNFPGPAPPANTSLSLSLFNESPPDAFFRYRSTTTYKDDGDMGMSSTLISAGYKSTLSHQETQSISSHHLKDIQNLPSSEKTEDLLSVDSGDEISSDSLGLSPHEEDSSDEEAQMHRRITGGRSREEEQGKPAISHLGDSFVPADAEQEDNLLTDEPEQLSEASMVLHNQKAGSGSELLCDLPGLVPLGLDMNSGHSDNQEHTHCDPLQTCQASPHDSDPTGSEPCRPGSSFSIMKENHKPTTPTWRGEISGNELKTSGRDWSGKSLHHPPKTISSPLTASALSSLSHSSSPLPSVCLSYPTLDTHELDAAFRPLSQAVQEIMEICNVDQSGCEDPDLDTDTSAHTLRSLEQELWLMANATGKQTSVYHMENSGSQDQCANQQLTRRGRVDDKQKEEEEAAQRDRQSVLLLP